ncbi:hypothetical protein GOP47_0006013 [Adiantum capillus-veneris]|uniref:Trichome birefringence-like N-terminal domain-containing protein n=1 Tax=Adiantum capillus-veneris TaxID=13818 RepID=A0A9D4V3L7_ADICA|nr:hypothetical protein GOP47_0006013 [Adiantum capillus-veneris]
MELSKTPRSLFIIPSRWAPILLGLILGLFISVFFGTNLTIIRRAVPARSSSSSLTTTSSYHSITTTTTTASINRLFIQLLFKSFDPNAARLHEDRYMTRLNPGYKGSYKPDRNDVAQNDYRLHKYPSTSSTPKKQPSLNVETEEASPTDAFSNQRQTHQHVYRAIDGLTKSSSRGEDSPTTRRQAHHQASSLLGSITSTCDISIGKWIRDDTYPLYDHGSCPYADEAFNCHTNGRPDKEYARWRWAPRDCSVPRFNGTDMLERLRGKRIVFVGDSLNRNQWESLLCMLRESLPDKSRVVQVQGNQISKLPGGYGFKFLDYDLRVELYVSQYLVDKQEASNEIKYIIRLDKMDKLERRWRKANVLVFNTGHWWTSDKIGDGDNCFQEGNEVYAKLDVMVAYNKALTTWANWVDTYVNPENTTVFFRGYSPVHYMGGQWNSGGQCQNETEPIYKESYLTAYPDKMQALERVIQGMRVPVHVLNITRLSDFRKDGHPAVFGHPPHQAVAHQDCSHWCLPGLPDTWNELLSFALFDQARRSTPIN